jgi:hypothetical protein
MIFPGAEPIETGMLGLLGVVVLSSCMAMMGGELAGLATWQVIFAQASRTTVATFFGATRCKDVIRGLGLHRML